MIDWPIVGTGLVLRITQTGAELQPKDVEQIIDFSVQKVVAKINSGRGRATIDNRRFFHLTARIDMRIFALQDAVFTYFVLGKQSIVSACVSCQATGLSKSDVEHTPKAHTYQNGEDTDMQWIVGDVIAGVWQYMGQPWSSFREIVFDVLFRGAEGSDYIGCGQITKFGGFVTKVGNMSHYTDV